MMNRRKFLRNGGLLGLGSLMVNPLTLTSTQAQNLAKTDVAPLKTAKNIIFMVSDGMSIGTLTLCDLMMQRKLGKESAWMHLYRKNLAKRALMDTASANSLVTDSAAAGSAWGGGVRVNNGSINVGPNGEIHEPILVKFKKSGKAVGCVTTVPITHATPASFCVNVSSRSAATEIADKYLDLKFDVLLGGGVEDFEKSGRKDGRDLLQDFKNAGLKVAINKQELLKLKNSKEPVLGVFHKDGLPYTVDQNSDKELQEKVPTLPEMTAFAIDKLSKNPNGFVMQVEAGKVDWAAHANDPFAIINDQYAFDQALQIALDFADKNTDTLVVFTTDHGNSNPGLFAAKNCNETFDEACNAKQSNEWILKGITRDSSLNQIIDRIQYASNCKIKYEDAQVLQKLFVAMENDGEYNPYKLPFRQLSEIQGKYNNIGWGGVNHSADFVELGMYGAGSEMLPPFVKNTDLHNFMLRATGLV
jgi:alkaline phosphatase